MIYKITAIIMACFLGISQCCQSHWWKAHEAAEDAEAARAEAAHKANMQPHPVRQDVDGCTVYAFLDGEDHWHYFAKCADSLKTNMSSDWDESQTHQVGKVTTTEIIHHHDEMPVN